MPQPRPKIQTIYWSMIARCKYPSQKSYKDYGGRGIKVCDRWKESFEAFVADMGPRPDGYTIERKDHDGDYEPGNCIWIPRAEQAANKRNNKVFTAFGRTQHLAAWAKELGCNPHAIRIRLKLGWDLERALSEPIPDRPNAKLTLDQAREIRAGYPLKTFAQLAAQYGVSKKTAINVVHGRIFRE